MSLLQLTLKIVAIMATGVITFYLVYSDISRTLFLDTVSDYLEQTVVTTSKDYGKEYSDVWGTIFDKAKGDSYSTQ